VVFLCEVPSGGGAPKPNPPYLTWRPHNTIMQSTRPTTRPTMLTQRVALGGSSLPMRAIATAKKATPNAFRLSVQAAKEYEVQPHPPMSGAVHASA
jgi:hypothetical protein